MLTYIIKTAPVKTLMNICYCSFSRNRATDYGTQNYENSAITGTSKSEFTILLNYYCLHGFSSSGFLSR